MPLAAKTIPSAQAAKRSCATDPLPVGAMAAVPEFSGGGSVGRGEENTYLIAYELVLLGVSEHQYNVSAVGVSQRLLGL